MSLVESLTASRPRRQLLIVGLIAVVICAALSIAYLFVFRSAYEVLFSDLRPQDAATIVAELDKKKISYRLKDGGRTILAPANVIDSTRLNLVSADLPLKGAVGFELFNKSDIGLTEFAQKINYQRALQGELARTIMGMDGVDSVRVHLAVPESTIFRDDRKPPKASVTILPKAGQILSPGAVEGIRRLVAAAVTDLEVSNVVVLDDHGVIVSAEASPDQSGMLEQPLSLLERGAIQQYYEARARRALVQLDLAAQIHATAYIPPEVTEVALDTWSPTARAFPLQVTLTTSQILGPGRQTAALSAVQGALGRSTGGLDQIVFSTSGPVAGVVVADPLPSAVEPTLARAEPTPSLRPTATNGLWWGLLLVLAALLAAAFFLHRNSRHPATRPLTARKRENFVNQLKGQLEKEAYDAS